MSRFAPWVLSSVDHGTQLLCTVGCAVSWRVSPCSGSFFKGFDGMGPLKTHIMSHPPGASLIPEALLCAHCPPAPTWSWTLCRNRRVWVLLLPSGDLGACVASVLPVLCWRHLERTPGWGNVGVLVLRSLPCLGLCSPDSAVTPTLVL